MTDVRAINYDHIHLEEPKLKMGETFVSRYPDLDTLPNEARQAYVTQVAKMATAAEVFIFDQEVGACHMNHKVYEFKDGTQKGIILCAEKTEEGIFSDVIWASPEDLIKTGFTYGEVRRLGFNLGC